MSRKLTLREAREIALSGPAAALRAAPRLTRSRALRVKPEAVDTKRRVISRYSVITRGEALGHGLWVDGEFLRQIAEAGNAAELGVKGRFTHPDISSDGLGKHLGRTRDLELDGNQVRGDLHLAKAASRSPDGDLAGYVLELAAEDPGAFGASIVFSRDLEAEVAFAKENGAETREDGGVFIDFDGAIKGFKSPDPENVGNLRHARLKALHASDVVDEPAANPAGFFGAGQEVAARASAALGYLVGVTDEAPEAVFGFSAPRAREFLVRWLDNRGLEIRRRKPVEFAGANRTANGAEEFIDAELKPALEATMPETETKPATIAELRERYDDSDFVLEQLEAEATLEQAENAWKDAELERQQTRIEELEAENERLAAAPAPTRPQPERRRPTVRRVKTREELSGPEPVDFGGTDPATDGPASTGFMALVEEVRDEMYPHLTSQQRATRHGMHKALQVATKRYPQEYRAFLQWQQTQRTSRPK